VRFTVPAPTHVLHASVNASVPRSLRRVERVSPCIPGGQPSRRASVHLRALSASPAATVALPPPLPGPPPRLPMGAAPSSPSCVQVDLSLEANHLWRFNENFARDRCVTLPAPLFPWVSPDVLMETFEEGMHISAYMEADTDETRRASVADAGSHCLLSMLLRHNFIHSDLHPGNILLRWQLPDGPLVAAAAAMMRWLSDRPAEQARAEWQLLRAPLVSLTQTRTALTLTPTPTG
jgi:ABC1 atypical kinase-like domain